MSFARHPQGSESGPSWNTEGFLPPSKDQMTRSLCRLKRQRNTCSEVSAVDSWEPTGASCISLKIEDTDFCFSRNCYAIWWIRRMCKATGEKKGSSKSHHSHRATSDSLISQNLRVPVVKWEQRTFLTVLWGLNVFTWHVRDLVTHAHLTLRKHQSPRVWGVPEMNRWQTKCSWCLIG